MAVSPGKSQVKLSPFRGFVSSRPRDDVGVDQFTGPSLDWLLSRGRIRRRSGSTIFGDTLSAGAEVAGILETAIGFLARRMVSAKLPSVTDDYPAPLMLFTEETTKKAATLAWRSTNGTDSWRTVGREFSATHYPDSGLVHHRVVPLVYENEYGGLTLHRLTTAADRQFLAAGSRDMIALGGEYLLPSRTGVPVRWNGRFNDATGSGTEGCEVFPAGLIPPLQVPDCSAGNDLGASVQGPWKGSDAFFYSILFENDRGELSMFTVPRPPGSAWSGFAGFGYMHVDSANPTHYFDSVVYSNVAVGPPGTRWVHILRTGKVDVTTTGAGAIVSPSIDDLQFIAHARIPNGVTTYTDTDGNDLSLDPDPRITDMVRRGLTWPPCARVVGRFDGHVTLGDTSPNKYALIVAPWETGAINYAADSASLYGSTSYFVAITPLYIYLRSVTGGTATDTTMVLSGLSLRDLVDRINRNTSLTNTALTGCYWYAPVVGGDRAWIIFRASAFTGVAVGDVVVSGDFPSGTKVTKIYAPVAGIYAVGTSSIPSSDSVAPPTGESVTFVRRVSDADSYPWGAAVVPGADADEDCDNLLRTYVEASIAQFTTGSPVIDVSAGNDDEWITPGMFVYRDENGQPLRGFSLGTVVIAVDHTAHTVTCSTNALRDDLGGVESVKFAYDTGDTTLGLLPGFVRMFGNAFPAVLPWRKSYLDTFAERNNTIIFSAASPGYAQDALNTYFASNVRRGAPDSFGPLMGLADLGAAEIQFFAAGRLRLWNPRTGETHNDTDYTQTTLSWRRGLRSPYALDTWNGWAIFLSDEGFFATRGGHESEDVPLSADLYDRDRRVGYRGELEYAIEACVSASEGGTDAYRVHAQVHGSVLHVRYWTASSVGHVNREIRLDLTPVLVERKAPAWSTPLTLRHSVSAWVAKADGLHHYAARDSNVGTGDGRVDEIDAANTDNATFVRPVGYSGTLLLDDLWQLQPLRFGLVAEKAGTGLHIGAARDSSLDHADMEFGDVAMPSTHGHDYGREVLLISPGERVTLDALTVRIRDNGTGDPAEVSRAILYADPYEPIYGQGGK